MLRTKQNLEKKKLYIGVFNYEITNDKGINFAWS